MKANSKARAGQGARSAPQLTVRHPWRLSSGVRAGLGAFSATTRLVVAFACIATLGCGDDAGHTWDGDDAQVFDSVSDADATTAPDTVDDPGVGAPFSRTYYAGGTSGLAAGPDGQVIFLGSNRIAAIAPDGEVVWDGEISAPGNENLRSVHAVGDSLILAGHEGTLGALPSRGWLMQLTEDHEVAWSQNFRVRRTPDAEPDGWTVATDIAPTDGGYIACGYSGTDAASTFHAWVLEVSSTGEIAWIRTYDTPGPGGTLAMSLLPGPEGSFFVQGIQGLSASPALWIFRVDGDGELIWSRTLGSTYAAYAGTSVTAPQEMIGSPSGGFALAAWTPSREPWVLEFDESGELLRHRVITFASDADARLSSIAFAPDDGIVAVGTYMDAGEGGRDLWALLLDASNEALWYRGFGDAWADAAGAVVATDDGGYAIAAKLGGVNEAGYSASRSWVLKLSSTGSSGPSCPAERGTPPPFGVTEPVFDVADLAVAAEVAAAVTLPVELPASDEIDFNRDQVFIRPAERVEENLCITHR